MKNVTILGATGSIGLNTLSVLSLHPDKYRVFALSANNNWQKMLELCKTHQPKYAAMVDADAAKQLQQNLASDTIVLGGESALVELAAHSETDYLMAAIVGAAGMASTLAAAHAGKRIMLANKESLVLAGDLLMSAVKRSGAELIPVDSEHSAIFQCLQGGRKGLSKVQLTASGGPFLGASAYSLARVTPEEACAHPNWSMGRKISVDSATMMNKGLEVIEAHFLFGLSDEQIDVVIHPQSIIHSMAYFDDGSVLSQLGLPDMRTAISYALSYPDRHISGAGVLDLSQQKPLEFYPPNLDVFSCLRLAYDALKTGLSAAGTLSAANEIAVAAFLNNKIGFLEIGRILEQTLETVPVVSLDTLDDVMENDQLSRQVASAIIEAACG